MSQPPIPLCWPRTHPPVDHSFQQVNWNWPPPDMKLSSTDRKSRFYDLPSRSSGQFLVWILPARSLTPSLINAKRSTFTLGMAQLISPESKSTSDSHKGHFHHTFFAEKLAGAAVWTMGHHFMSINDKKSSFFVKQNLLVSPFTLARRISKEGFTMYVILNKPTTLINTI